VQLLISRIQNFFNFAFGGGGGPAVPLNFGAPVLQTHLEYVTIIAFRPQQWLRERAKLRCSRLPVLLVYR
jgi:hypothetical protein